MDSARYIMATAVHSSGLQFTLSALRQRYSFLRKIKEPVSFTLLYYPYWSLSYTQEMTWPLFGTKYATEMRIMDAVTGRSYKLFNLPELRVEYIRQLQETSSLGDEALVWSEDLPELTAATHLAEPRVCPAEALQRGEQDARKSIGKFYNRPLGFMANLNTIEAEGALIYKPFWVMRPTELEQADNARRVFVFDASTGLGGTADYWNVIDYVLQLDTVREHIGSTYNAQEEEENHEKTDDLATGRRPEFHPVPTGSRH